MEEEWRERNEKIICTFFPGVRHLNCSRDNRSSGRAPMLCFVRATVIPSTDRPSLPHPTLPRDSPYSIFYLLYLENWPRFIFYPNWAGSERSANNDRLAFHIVRWIFEPTLNCRHYIVVVVAVVVITDVEKNQQNRHNCELSIEWRRRYEMRAQKALYCLPCMSKRRKYATVTQNSIRFVHFAVDK